MVGAKTSLELREHILDRDSTAHRIAIEASGEVVAGVVVNAEDGVASVGLTESLEGLSPVERVDEHRHERRAGGDDAWIAERTAREVLAALSPGVLTEVHPEGLVLLAGDREGGIVVDVPLDVADGHPSLRGGIGDGSLGVARIRSTSRSSEHQRDDHPRRSVSQRIDTRHAPSMPARGSAATIETSARQRCMSVTSSHTRRATEPDVTDARSVARMHSTTSRLAPTKTRSSSKRAIHVSRSSSAPRVGIANRSRSATPAR